MDLIGPKLTLHSCSGPPALASRHATRLASLKRRFCTAASGLCLVLALLLILRYFLAGRSPVAALLWWGGFELHVTQHDMDTDQGWNQNFTVDGVKAVIQTSKQTTEWNIKWRKLTPQWGGHWSHLTFTMTPVHLLKLLILEAAVLWRVEAADRRLPGALLVLSAAAQQEMPRLQAYQWGLSTGTHQLRPGDHNVNRTSRANQHVHCQYCKQTNKQTDNDLISHSCDCAICAQRVSGLTMSDKQIHSQTERKTHRLVKNDSIVANTCIHGHQGNCN